MHSLPHSLQDVLDIAGYHAYWNSAEKAGYSGVGLALTENVHVTLFVAVYGTSLHRLYTRVKPVSVTFGMGIEKHDTEGRLITCEYENFYLITACELGLLEGTFHHT